MHRLTRLQMLRQTLPLIGTAEVQQKRLEESEERTQELEAALAKIDYTKEAANGSEAYFAARVQAVTDAIAAASQK